MTTSPWRSTEPLRKTLPVLLTTCFLTGASAMSSINTHLGHTAGQGDPFHSLNPVFNNVQLTPPQFLMISSPSQGKIVYTPLRNFKSLTGRTYALIDSGLDQPRGLAFDRERGALYVADFGAQKIFRYHVYVKNGDDQSSMGLYSDGVQITILQGVPVSWVACDPSGDVFYSDPASKVIGKIPHSTIMTLANGFNHARELSFLSEKQLVTQAISVSKQELNGAVAPTPTEMPSVSTKVSQLYEGSQNSHVVAPGGLVTDGYHVYWTNTDQGITAGSVVRGFMDPQMPAGAAPNASFPTFALTNDTEQAFGVAKSSTMIIYSSNNTGIGKVYGVLEKTGQVHTLTAQLSEPRGLVWDGDQTVFVADELLDGVWSLPVGRLVDNTVLTKSAVLTGAYGVALLSNKDKAWYVKAGAEGLRGTGRLCGVWALVAALLAWL